MADLDTSRAPRGVLAAQRLVVAVAERGDLAERHYLELKSTLDLSTKRDKEKIAKFVLGASNRMPDIAADAFEGYAAMIVGVSQDEIVGIPPVEMMEIAKVVQQFVGAAGPRWDIVWVPVEGSTNQVLVILVDPPIFGQGPFPCRASGTSLTNGRIYIRADGETREANAEELDLLLKRGSTPPEAELEFAVEVIGEVSTVSLDDDRTVEEYLRAKKEQLLAALPSNQPPAPTGLNSTELGLTGFSASHASALKGIAAMASAMSIPEERTEEEYRSAIERWEARFRVSWSAAKSRIVASRLTPIVVKISNLTTAFLHDVEVKLHLEGAILAFDYVDPEWADSFSDLELPSPPREWGPRERSLGIPNYSHLANMIPVSPGTYLAPSVSFRNGGSVDLDLSVGDLRPLGTYESEDEEFVLVVSDASLTSVHGIWQLTARDHHKVFTGATRISVADPRDITGIARQVLGLENEEADI